MKWTRVDTIALANHACACCHGLGLRPGLGDALQPCNCVLRAIFRACYAHFRHCAVKEKYLSKISLDFVPSGEKKFIWGRKDEEFMADFVLVSRRILDDFHFRVFRFHFLAGAHWKQCCLRLGIDRGAFFHAVYRIEQTLGRVFRELRPYSLFPLDEYYHGPRMVCAPCKQRPPDLTGVSVRYYPDEARQAPGPSAEAHGQRSKRSFFSAAFEIVRSGPVQLAIVFCLM